MEILSSVKELSGVSSDLTPNCAYPCHLRTNLEMLYCMSGTRGLRVGKKSYELRPGDFVVLFPFQLHEFFAGESGYGWLITAHPATLDLCRERLLTLTPENPIIGSVDVPPRMKTFLELIFDTAEGPDRSENLKRLIELLLLELFAAFPMCPRADGRCAGCRAENAERLLSICIEHNRDPDFSAESLAREAGLNVRTVSRFFSGSIGVSFPRFIAMLRQQYAIELMQSGVSATEAAFASGFGSIRTFDRSFKEVYGSAPHKYIAARG